MTVPLSSYSCAPRRPYISFIAVCLLWAWGRRLLPNFHLPLLCHVLGRTGVLHLEQRWVFTC